MYCNPVGGILQDRGWHHPLSPRPRKVSNLPSLSSQKLHLDQIRQTGHILQTKLRHLYIEKLVRSDGDQFVGGTQQFGTTLAPDDLNLGSVGLLVSLREDEVHAVDVCYYLHQRGLALAATHVRHLVRYGDDDVIGAGLRQAVGILARYVELEAGVVMVLDDGDAIAAPLQFADQSLQQRCLAATGAANDGDNKNSVCNVSVQPLPIEVSASLAGH